MRNILLAAFQVFAILLIGGSARAESLRVGDILIRNGRVIDGTGAAAVEADVLVRGDKIIAVEKSLRIDSADTTGGVTIIDAAGRVVTPGFIDTHSHGDPATHPDMHNFLAMGVTTLCLGQDGSSNPVTTMSQWLDDMATTGLGPNVLTFVGHGTVRTESGVGLSTQITPAQLDKMAALVEQGLEAGAFGLTTGLEYQPGSFSRAEELAAVARPVGKRGLVVMSHMRNEDDDQVTSSILELINQCRTAGANAHISHIKSVYGKGSGRAEEILTLLDKARAEGTAITADIYPYTASHTGLSILFPPYALPPNSYTETLATRRDELVQYLNDRVTKRNGPEATLLGTGENAGKTLADLAAERGKPFAEVLADLGPRGGSAAYFVMNEDLQSRLLVADGVNICTDGSPTMRHPRSYGAFARVIRKFVNDEKLLTLEEAIHKMSGLPAQTIGLDKQARGTIKPGNFADILIFDPAKVQDTATFEEPHQLAEGFETVLVNGVIIRDESKFNGKRGGQVIRHQGKK